MNKVLIVTYYWPPASGIAVQRVAKFCKYLSDFNWQPIILTVNNGTYIQADNSYSNDIAKITDVYGAASIEPHNFYRKLKKPGKPKSKQASTGTKCKSSTYELLANFIRVNFFIPDARIGWYPGAVKTGIEVIKQHQPKLIFSTAPPFTTHLVAKKLKKESGLPWIADFRDAWLENNLYNKPYRLFFSQLINKHLEKSVLSEADRIVCIGKNLSSLLTSKLETPKSSSYAADKASVISNGYDHQDIVPANGSSSNFCISYFGTLYSQRIPQSFLSSVADFIKENIKFKKTFVFRLFGSIDVSAKTLLEQYLPLENIEYHTALPYPDFMREIQKPQLLLLTVDQVKNNNIIVTGKIFDYFTSANPILAFGPNDGDAASMLKTMNAGKMFDYDTPNAKEYIHQKFSEWENNNLKRDWSRLETIERRFLTKKLAELFNKTCDLR